MRRSIVAPTLSAAIVALTGGAGVHAGGDGDGDGDKTSLIAELQFHLFLLTETEFVPTDVTCTDPLSRVTGGELLCYALIGPRVTVAAIAAPEAGGGYRFTPLNKVDPAELEPLPADPGTSAAATEQPALPEGAADQAILDAMASAVADAEGLGDVLIESNPEIQSVDEFTFDEPAATLRIAVTTDATDPGTRDAIAFSVTDIMAYLWVEGEPTRDETATVEPGLEITVDGVVYTTPYDVMVRVADYDIAEDEWLDVVSDENAFSSLSKPVNVAKAAKRLGPLKKH